MEFSKEYENLPNKLVVDPSLINITDSKSEVNIISNKVDVISDGSNNVAELNLIGKYGGNNTAVQSNAKLHIGAHNNPGELIGGGIGFFTNYNSTSYNNNNPENKFENNFITFYRSVGTTNEIVFQYNASSISATNGVMFKRNIGIGGENAEVPLHIQRTSIIHTEGSTNYFDISNDAFQRVEGNSGLPGLKNYALLINPTGGGGNIGMNGNIYNVSDERIKTEIEDVPDTLALSQINNIQPKYYHYKDPLKKNAMKTVGFIAQNVNEHLPNAIAILTEFIPNGMFKISDSNWTEDNGKYSIVIDNLELDKPNRTKRVKFIVCDKEDHTDSKDLILNCESDNKTFIFDKKWREVFVYGTEVNDLHTIDKAQIFALHHAGIQELSKQLNEKDEKISTLERENTSIKQRLDALEASVLALQNN